MGDWPIEQSKVRLIMHSAMAEALGKQLTCECRPSPSLNHQLPSSYFISFRKHSLCIFII
uniref:Uncharacterized protein n=1 Tax=Ascaris lumbricoides TaxID=6252 RepID=A0A0M3I3F9_ASCLU